MKTNRLINTEYVPPIDLQILSDTYNTLEQGHRDAIQFTSELKSAMAQYDLNEAEDEWRANKLQEIQNTIDENTLYGNSSFAIDDLMKKAGDIASDPELLGRLRAQQDYKAFQSAINNNQTLTEEDKEYFREVNPYYYKDKVDSNGRIIGGSKWSPTKQFVDKVDMTMILDNALKWAAKESGGSNEYRWLDANGNPTSDITQSVTGEYYDNRSNTWQRLTKDKLQAAVLASIENTPGAKASLMQDYEIAKWKYNKNDNYNPDVTDNNGILLTPTEYIEKRINPFYKAATYYNQSNQVTYGDAWKAQLELIRAQEAAAQQNTPIEENSPNYIYNRYGDMISTEGSATIYKNDLPIEAQANITSNKQKIVDIIKSYNPNLDFTIDNKTNEDIINIAKNNGVEGTDLYDIITSLETIDSETEYLESIFEGLTSDEREQAETYSAIISMSNLPNNKYSKELTTQINSYYNGAKEIAQYLPSDEEYQNFLDGIGGESNLKKLGIKVGYINGKRYVSLPKENSNALYTFAGGLTKAQNKTGLIKSIGRELINQFQKELGGNTSFRIYEDGSTEVIMSNSIETGSGIQNYLSRTSRAEIFNPFIGKVNNLKYTYDYNTNNTKDLALTNVVIPYSSPNAVENAYMAKSDFDNQSKYLSNLKLDTEEANTAIKNNLDIVNKGAYIYDNSINNYIKVDTSGELKELQSFLSSPDSIISTEMSFDVNSRKWGANITINNDKINIKGEPLKDKEPTTQIKLFVPNAINSDTIRSWNNDTKFNAIADVIEYTAANKNIPLTDYSSFSGTSKITLIPNNGYYNVRVRDYADNKSKDNIINKVISKEEAEEYRNAYLIWHQTYNAVKSGIDVNPEAVIANAQLAATMLAKVEGYDSPAMIDFYTKQLLNNINEL